MGHDEPCTSPPNDLLVRTAEPRDLEAMTRAMGDADYFADRLARQDAGRGQLLVALLSGQPVGHVYLGWEQPDEPELRRHLPDVPILQHLLVLGPHQRRGIGTRLMRAAERRLRGRGHHRIALAVEESNVGVVRFYDGLGYQDWRLGQVRCRPRDVDMRSSAVEICFVLVKAISK
jgi:GNAT superfamily N-acetyltransferase